MARLKIFMTIPIGLSMFFFNCGLLDIEQTPTKTKMLGLWELTEAYNEDGDIIDNINFPITAFHFSSDKGVISTAGPMISTIVYGDSSAYVNIASKFDQFFNYTSLSFTNGRWGIDGGYTDRFTLEMTLEGIPGQKAITDLLGLLGIGNDYLDVVIFHKFIDVKVTFELFSDSVMTWEFDNQTDAVYNTLDKYLNPVFWGGWPTDSFLRSKYIFKKRAGTLQSLVQNAAN